ncbi:hypothetical protein K435DRAFT_802168 [Dendrothele bispora CBS 962.96]|uniref:Uncharacterized protein n=1 Tax=Dendrothele bispora (strain CBS 962.96) TaxID=1314807 RepID=A0A4S8LLT8_DENBC|nr:hypothetical protein K435DRAFT_802168 [Dendrothele bispora CBS 962.96]
MFAVTKQDLAGLRKGFRNIPSMWDQMGLVVDLSTATSARFRFYVIFNPRKLPPRVVVACKLPSKFHPFTSTTLLSDSSSLPLGITNTTTSNAHVIGATVPFAGDTYCGHQGPPERCFCRDKLEFEFEWVSELSESTLDTRVDSAAALKGVIVHRHYFLPTLPTEKSGTDSPHAVGAAPASIDPRNNTTRIFGLQRGRMCEDALSEIMSGLSIHKQASPRHKLQLMWVSWAAFFLQHSRSDNDYFFRVELLGYSSQMLTLML